MTRYWIKLAPHGSSPLTLGCGVTALDWEDAKWLVSQFAFKGEPLPEIIQVIENVDVSTLDAGHVIPNMGVCSLRGIWFPMGYQ